MNVITDDRNDRIYSPENYAAFDVDNFRKRFPEETIVFTDKQLYELVMSSEDDMDDEGWKTFFNEAASKLTL